MIEVKGNFIKLKKLNHIYLYILFIFKVSNHSVIESTKINLANKLINNKQIKTDASIKFSHESMLYFFT
jgi:hypothetical protein